MGDPKIATATTIFAGQFYMSDKVLSKLNSLGGCAWIDAKDAQDLANKIGGFPSVKIVVSEYVPVNDAVLDNAPSLKGVIAYGAGYNHIDLEAMKQKGVLVCNCKGQNAQAVAEMVFGLLLCLMRKIHKTDPWVRRGEWAKADRCLPEWITGRELWKKSMGIIGLGQIGTRVAKIAKAFDMTLLGYSPSVDNEVYRKLGVKAVSVAELMSQSDVVTLHVPLTSDTKKMINADALSNVKPGMIFVNTSRGEIVDEQALVDALQAGQIGGAALDVFAAEPLPLNHLFTRMDNVLLSPHIGALSHEAGARLSETVLTQTCAILEGNLPENLIT